MFWIILEHSKLICLQNLSKLNLNSQGVRNRETTDRQQTTDRQSALSLPEIGHTEYGRSENADSYAEPAYDRLHIKTNVSFTKVTLMFCFGLRATFLPHWALSCNFSSAENLASLSLQDGATKWLYYQSASQPTSQPPDRLH